DGCIHVLAAGRRDDVLLRAALEVCGGLRLAGEQAGAFEHKLHAQLAPRQLRRITLGKHADALAIDDHRVAVDPHFARKSAVHGVIAREMRVGLGIAEIVERHDLQLSRALALVQCAQHVAPDPTVTVDADLDCHDLVPRPFVNWLKVACGAFSGQPRAVSMAGKKAWLFARKHAGSGPAANSCRVIPAPGARYYRP